ncbi:uncharacterized protein G2W53_041527 [Senna tora]|uniref:Uncharacterized protein n=1 Tax=Senna tora TaxID=362788 RepID=A0A834W1H9_9FABA|nr:uncharacterized protein G2W53_041527 [Senna tora]
MLRHDQRSSHAMKTPIRASNPLGFTFDSYFVNVFEIRPQFLIRNILRHDPRFAFYMKTAIRASNPLGLANTTRTDRHDPRPSHAKKTSIRAYQIHSVSQIKRESIGFTHLHNKTFDSYFMNVFEILPQFLIRNMLRHDPRSAYAMKTSIRASNPLGLANTTRTDRFHSLAQQDF